MEVRTKGTGNAPEKSHRIDICSKPIIILELLPQFVPQFFCLIRTGVCLLGMDIGSCHHWDQPFSTFARVSGK